MASIPHPSILFLHREGAKGARTSTKKGQLTVYIALGILIIILAGIVFFIQRAQVTKEIEASVKRIVVPPEAQPMQEYLTQCLEKTTIQGIQLMASQGGWIQPKARINKARPTEGEAVPLSPDSDQYIPYWYFLASPNDCTGTCTFAGLAPPLKKPLPESMEAQLDLYIATHVKECLGDYSSFTSQGYIVSEQGPLLVSTTILPKSVTAYAAYPLRFERPGASLQTNEIFTSIPVKLGKIYQLANDLTSLERDHRFLERHLRQLIDLQSGTGQDQLPPISEVEFRFASGTAWTKTSVKNRLKDLLATFTPFLQVFDTANYRKIIPPLHDPDPVRFDRIYNRNMLVITSATESYPDIEARFSYLPWWEPYFDLNCQGELCRPDVLLNTLGITYGIQRYLFSYDMSFPVLVELKDPDAFQGKGLTFDLMLEANTRNNEPLPGAFSPITMELGSGASLFCDPGQMTGRNLSLTVFDGKTVGPVAGADVLYTCGQGSHPNSSTCYISKTDSTGRAAKQLPVCLGGTLTILKDGYASTSIPFDSDIPGNSLVQKTMEPVRHVAINVKRLRLIKTPQGWQLSSEPVGLDSREQATVSMRKAKSAIEEEFFAVAEQFGDVIEDAKSGLHTDIGLLPGNYSIDVLTMFNPDPPLVIPVQHRCYEKKCQDVPEQPIVFDDKNPFPSGGASYTYEVRKQDLDRSVDGSGTLTLYAIDVALDLIPEQERVAEDLDLLASPEKLTATYRNRIEPEWSKQG